VSFTLSDMSGLAVALAVSVLALVGLATEARRLRADFEPDERPSDVALLGRALRRNPLFPLPAVALLVAVVVADSAGVVAAVMASAAIVAAGATLARDTVRSGGIEREHLLVATSVGFLAVIAMSACWSMFEVFADGPLISMRVPFVVGLLAMIGSLIVLRRRAA
jgi:hypothetical protein